jgi:hypothetical protein
VASIVAEDIREKPRVLAGLSNGHAFVFVAAWDRGDEVEDDIAKELQKHAIKVDDGQVLFITGDAIARLLQTFPGLVARFLGWDMPLVDLDEWSSFRSLSNPFQVDDDLQQTMENLRGQLERSGSITRVVGAAGDGKTRLVLETLRGSFLAAGVLYARDVSEISPALVAHLKRTQDIQCTLVVDEVDDANAELLKDKFSRMPSGVRLVMIGLDASGRAPKETLQVEGLSEDLLSATILAIVPGLPQENAISIARDCGRSPKLAVLIAGRVKENPTLAAPQRLLADGPILNALDRYLNIDPNSPAWEAISVTSLLMRLGWAEDAEKESDILFKAVGLDPTVARRQVQQLHERYGIAPAANRLRYVSPAILADHLAARQLSSWTREKMETVLAALTPAMADSFARRIRRMSPVLENRKVVEEVILGDQGPFRTLKDLEDGHVAVLLRRLAAPFPSATLNTLRRVIEPASIEDLEAASKSRREMVWALEELLWREDTFEQAADLLLRLAIAENEKLGNNASQIWVSSFQTILGRTAAGPIVRARVLKRAATNGSSASRRFAAEAIGAALQSERLSRSGMPPADIEGIPAEEWHPATYKEWAEALTSYLNILTSLLSDVDEEVRKTAVGALAGGLHTVATLPSGAFENWIALARTLIGTDYERREPVIKAIQWTRNRLEQLLKESGAAETIGRKEGESEDDSKIHIFNERLQVLADLGELLRGTDFSSRLRLALSHNYRSLRSREAGTDAELEILTQLKGLAHEAVEQPSLLEGEWTYLLNDKNWSSAERWIEVLGAVDEERVFTSALTKLAQDSSRAAMWLSLYELAHATALCDPTYLDKRIEQMLKQGIPATIVFDLLYRAGYQPSRAALMLELFSSGDIPPEYINFLAYHPWGAVVPAQEALSLVQAGAARANHLDAIIPFVANYLTQVKEAKPLFQDFVLSVLTAPTKKPQYFRPIDEWVELARIYVDVSPTLISTAALKRIVDYEIFHPTDYIENILEPAWKVGDKAQLFEEVFAPWISSRDIGGWHIRQDLEGISFEDLGIEYLINWVGEDPENRAHDLAQVIGPPVGRPSDLHAMLLEKFGAYGVGSAFSAKFMSGGWVGPTSGWYRSKLEQAKTWLSDERPSVAEWAQRLVRGLESDLERELARELEEPLLY